jgi:type I restriction enzyme S subunit
MAREYLIGDFLKRIKRPLSLNDNQDYKLVTIKMNHNGVVLRGTKKGSEIKSNMYEVKQGDFILSGIDARNGAFGIVPSELDGAIVTNDFWYFEIDDSIISKRLFLELTATTWFDEICKRGSDGTTQRIRLQKDKFFNQSIMLPEGNEQRELLDKILSFKSSQSKLDSEIQTQKQLLAQLKQSILQEAIQGKLTADWRKENPNPEAASELLNRIKAEKAQLIKDKKIKKEKALPPITEEEIPFDLPEGWVWCRLGEISEYVQRGKSPKYVESSSIPVISQKCVQWDRFDFHKARFINENTLDKYGEERFLKDGDLLWNSTGDGTVGRLIEFVNTTGFNKVVVDSHVAVVRLMNSLTPKFALSYLSTKEVQDNLIVSGSTKQTELSKGTVLNHLIPLAPEKEQKAIVEKVESLMQKCQALEQEIKTSEANAQMLMQAVLKEAFEGKMVEYES